MEDYGLPPCECNISSLYSWILYATFLLSGSVLTLIYQRWCTKAFLPPAEDLKGGSVAIDINRTHSCAIELPIIQKEPHQRLEVATNAAKGSIELVGTGPGDPELLTVRAVRAIHTADLVLADRLTPPAILKLVKCRMHIAKKTKGNADQAQNELNQLGLHALREGLKVVRLKNGDPFMYGRGGEEVLFFRAYGFEPTVTPGISSSLSASMAAGIPVTHRGVANELCIATGQLKLGSDDPVFPEYRRARTTVLLMAVSRLPKMSVELQKLGYPKETPVAVIENAWRPDQRVVKANVQNISRIAEANSVSSPATIIIGNVVSALGS